MAESTVVHKMELRDVESVLRQKLGEQLSVLEYETEALIPLGENYCSTIMKVRALAREGPQLEPRELHLVAKMMPATDFQRQVFDSQSTFKKETFFYRELLPAYQQLGRRFGLAADKLFDNAPEFYGARFSRGARDSDKVDDDGVILMQNLKVLGYYTVDRFKGMDEEHARESIVVMARFHALGMAMKLHEPEFFEVVKRYSKCLQFEIDEDDVEEMNLFLEMIREDPVTAPYYEDVKDAMMLDMHEVWEAPPTEPWSTITHMDLWVNNIMYLKDSAERIVDVKFVDFQNYLFMSPLRDLVFFLMMNFNADIMASKFDELLDLYYESFVGHLEALECDTRAFARDKFDARLKIDAFWEFSHIPFMTKIMTTQLKHDDKIDEIESVLRNPITSPLFIERIRLYVEKYAEKGWFAKK